MYVGTVLGTADCHTVCAWLACEFLSLCDWLVEAPFKGMVFERSQSWGGLFCKAANVSGLLLEGCAGGGGGGGGGDVCVRKKCEKIKYRKTIFASMLRTLHHWLSALASGSSGASVFSAPPLAGSELPLTGSSATAVVPPPFLAVCGDGPNCKHTSFIQGTILPVRIQTREHTFCLRGECEQSKHSSAVCYVCMSTTSTGAASKRTFS